MPATRHDLILPDLGMGDTPVMASAWHLEVGNSVTEGDRLLEVVAGAAVVDLPAPASGTLVETLVDDDEPLVVGQVLGVIESSEADD